MSKAVILQHVEHEGPGRIVPVFRDFGIQTEVRHLYRGDAVPGDLDELRVLVVLGGPMGVGDLVGGGAEKFPFLAAEVELLKRMIAADRPVLGICLGAQLLAHAAGARVYPNVRPQAAAKAGEVAPPAEPAPEIGWHPVMFPFPGGTEPMVYGMHDGAMMWQWHFDTFDLPKLPSTTTPPAPPSPAGNALLASSSLCRNQAFRFKQRLFGFQFHFQCGMEDIEAMIAHGGGDIAKVMGAVGDQRLRDQSAKYFPAYERLGDRLIKNFVQFLKAY